MSASHLLVAIAWLGGGLAASARRGTRASALLMALVGVTWLLGDADRTLVLLHRGALAHLLLAYPSGRLGSRPARVAVFAFYVAALFGALLPGTGWAVGFAIGLPGATLVRFAAATGAVRRSRAVPFAAAVGVGAVLGAAAVTSGDLLFAYELALAGAAMALAIDLRLASWARAAVAGLVVDLGRRATDGRLRARLARVVGDPSLVVGYLLDDGGAPVDEDGREMTLPIPGGDRTVTSVEHDGNPVAVLVHDPASLGDPKLVADVASALGVAVANARMQAGLRSLMVEIEASTRRLVDAGRAQQRRVAAELRLHVSPALEEADRALQNAGATDLRDRLAELRAQLARFAEGLNPVALHEGGLAPALRVLATRAGLPVTLSLREERYSPEIETCAWFVCSEAIANALKHAKASQLSIRVAPVGEVLRVEIADDGAGGAEPTRGTGLRRLAERVAASGGLLTIESSPGCGTRLLADFELGANA